MAVLSEEAVAKRIESPLNLFNRLRSTTKKDTTIVSIPSPKAEDLIPDLEKRIDVAGSKSKALSVMNKVLNRLDKELDCIESKKLPSVVRDMATAIRSMEPEQTDKNNNGVQFVIYQPMIMQEADFGEVIEVRE